MLSHALRSAIDEALKTGATNEQILGWLDPMSPAAHEAYADVKKYLDSLPA